MAEKGLVLLGSAWIPFWVPDVFPSEIFWLAEVPVVPVDASRTVHRSSSPRQLTLPTSLELPGRFIYWVTQPPCICRLLSSQTHSWIEQPLHMGGLCPAPGSGLSGSSLCHRVHHADAQLTPCPHPVDERIETVHSESARGAQRNPGLFGMPGALTCTSFCCFRSQIVRLKG